jgi:hypothetical protein
MMSGALSSSTISCPRCKNRIAAAGVQAGTPTRCPKCHMEFLVSGNSLGRPLDEEEEYGLQALPPVGTVESVCFPMQSGAFLMERVPREPEESISESLSEAEEADFYHCLMQDEERQKKADEKIASQTEEPEEIEDGAWRPGKMLSVGLFRRGLPPFIFNIDVQVRTGFLTAVIFVPFFLLAKAVEYANAPNMGMATFGSWFAGMFFLAIGGVLGVFSLFYAGALAMSVLLDTVNGHKSIENWPRGFLFDWLLEAGFVAGAMFWSALPGLPLDWLLRNSGVPATAIFTACMAVFFPLALMAAVESGTFFFPGAATVWMSPFSAWPAWRDFYLLTIPLVALVVGFAAFAVSENLLWMIALASFLASVGWMLYFRLLGRLAWYASGRAEINE